jgi:hypothetical protein
MIEIIVAIIALLFMWFAKQGAIHPFWEKIKKKFKKLFK